MAQDPYKYFRVEAHELVGELAKGVLDLEKHADAALVARLLRQAHTLKGAARIVKHRELADLSHALEDVLGPLRDHPIPQRLDPALAIVDRMTAQLATLAQAPASEATTPMPPVAAPTTSTAPASSATPASGATPAPARVEASVARLDTEAIDEALGGLAAIHAMVGRVRTSSDPQLSARLLDVIDRELREVRRDVERVRLATAQGLVTALERTARDTALGSGKRVSFESRGADVRIDAQVLTALHGALVQLVRNAVVHGIEAPARRSASGKASVGRVAVSIQSLGRRIAVTCEDDGAGLDVDAIQRAARQRGLGADRPLEAGELFALLMRGGISTAKQITELSGRGIGMDVVRDVVQTLGGEVSARTGATGTAITLLVPVSIAALAVITVQAGGRTAAIPRAAVRRVARVRESDIVRVGDAASIAFDDVTVPCAALATLLGTPSAHGQTALFVDGGSGIAAITVDRVLGIEETVVRAVPPGAPIDPIVASVALDAEGDPYPVVDPHALVAAVRVSRELPAEAAPRKIRMLVVDDSLTTRMLEQSILEAAGFDVTVAASAEEGLEKLGRGAVDAILCDVEMPGMDGFSFVAELRARPALAHIPAILVTSRDAPEDVRRGAVVGAQGYIVKNQFDQSTLLDMIRKLDLRGPS